MRCLVALALLVVVASAGLAEAAGGHSCCQPTAATAPSRAAAHTAAMAMPCCPQPCKLLPAATALPPATETSAPVRWPASGPQRLASPLPPGADLPRLAVEASARTQQRRPLPTRPPRDGLALLSTLLL